MTQYDANQAHYITATAILVQENKFLIVKRAPHEKAFPNRWTVPGGKLKVLDYALRKRDAGDFWYNILEDNVRREVQEEVGLDIEEINYVTSLVYIRSDNIPSLIISLYAKPIGTTIRLCHDLTEYAWVTLEEAKNYDLIEGIYEELVMLDKKLKSGKTNEWKKPNIQNHKP